MAIKFIHMSDTHLGFTDLEIQDEQGRNIREEDVIKAFSDAVDRAIEEHPDFVIHSGDIFHRSSPTNRALVAAGEQITRITDSGIPFYMIAGNHDYPKSIFTSPIHELYETTDLIKIVFNEQLEIIEKEDFILHLLPHINSEQKFLEEVDKIKVADKRKVNILSMHLALHNYAMNEYGERIFPTEKIGLLKEFDYVALGHWHKFNHLEKYGNVYYSGSTERTSDNQTGYEKGIVKVTIDKKTTAEFIPVKLRRFEKIKIDDCYKKSIEEIINKIKEVAKSDKIEGAVFHLRLNDINPADVNDISRSVLDDIFNGALHYQVYKNVKGTEGSIEIDSESYDLKEHFFDEIKNTFEKTELEKVNEFSLRIWDELEEEESNAN